MLLRHQNSTAVSQNFNNNFLNKTSFKGCAWHPIHCFTLACRELARVISVQLLFMRPQECIVYAPTRDPKKPCRVQFALKLTAFHSKWYAELFETSEPDCTSALTMRDTWMMCCLKLTAVILEIFFL